MRLNAYVLAGDPAWIAQSIGAYYRLVDRIVVAYDRSGLSWAGYPLSVGEALGRLRKADPDGKIVLLPGDWVDPSRPALDIETEQRQAALDVASESADWVVQLDTDEILAEPSTFVRCISVADAHAASALHYPLRWLYARSRSGAFLEVCGRWWGTQSGYPGPLAVRAGTRLTHGRQASSTPTYRVDVTPWNTDPAHPRGARVHRVVSPAQAALHMSGVRTEAQRLEKSIVSGHASAHRWESELRDWRRRGNHPWLTSATTPLMRDPLQRFRVVRLPEYADVEL